MPVLKDKKVKVIKESKEFDSSTYLYWLKSMVLMRRWPVDYMDNRKLQDFVIYI